MYHHLLKDFFKGFLPRRDARAAGFGLVEAMIALGLLMIVGVAATSIFTRSSHQINLLSTSSRCSTVANNVIQSINSLGSRDTIFSPPLYFGLDLTTPITAGVLNGALIGVNKGAAKFSPSWFLNQNSAAILRYDLTTNPPTPILNNAQFVINGANLLQSLYNSDPSGFICSNAQGLDVTNKYRVAVGFSEGVEKIFLHVQPMDLTNGSPVGCPTPPIFSAPAKGLKPGAPGVGSPSNDIVADGFRVLGDTALSYRATVTVTAKDMDGTLKTCSSQQDFAHQMDNSRPAAPLVTSILTDSGVQLNPSLNPSQLSTSCNTSGGGYRNVSLEWQLDQIEDGSLILCKTMTSNGSGGPVSSTPFVNCSSAYFNVAGVQYPLSGAPTIGGLPIKMKMKFVGLPPDVQYSMEVRVVDTAGNFSSNVGQAAFRVDASRPSITGIAPDPANPNLGIPGDGQANRKVFPISSNLINSKWSFPANNGGEVQCNQGPVDLQVTYSGTLQPNFSSCSVVASDLVASACFKNGRCEVSVTGPIPQGTHYVTVRAADVCGSGGTYTYKWDTIQNMVVTGFINGNFDHSSYIAAPYYPMNMIYSYPDPKHVIAICGPGATNSNMLVENQACIESVDKAPTACTAQPGNFHADVFDICGNTLAATNAPGMDAQYQVHGKEGENCGTQSCSALSTGGQPLACGTNGQCLLQGVNPTAFCLAQPTVPCPLSPAQALVWDCSGVVGTCSSDGSSCSTKGASCNAGAGTCNFSGSCSSYGPGPRGPGTNPACLPRVYGGYTGANPPPPPPAPNCGNPSLQNLQVRCGSDPWSGVSYNIPTSGPAVVCEVRFDVSNTATVNFSGTLNPAGIPYGIINVNTPVACASPNVPGNPAGCMINGTSVAVTGSNTRTVTLAFNAGAVAAGTNYSAVRDYTIAPQFGCGNNTPVTATPTSNCVGGSCNLVQPPVPGYCP